MTPAEAHAAAAAEGLRLVCAENATGFKGVTFSTVVSKPFQAYQKRRGRDKYLGTTNLIEAKKEEPKAAAAPATEAKTEEAKKEEAPVEAKKEEVKL